MQAKKNKGVLSRAARLIGEVTVVKIVFHHVNSLLEIFNVLLEADLSTEPEPQTRVETLMAKILEVSLIIRLYCLQANEVAASRLSGATQRDEHRRRPSHQYARGPRA